MFYKKNRRTEPQTLITIAVFGLVITGLAFFIASFFAKSILGGVTLETSLFGVLRGTLIVAGLFFIVKAYQRVPVSIISPLSMFIMFPMLFLSWAIFDDPIEWLEILFIVIMFCACLTLVFIQANYTKKKGMGKVEQGGLASKLGRIRSSHNCENKGIKKSKKSFWIGIFFLLCALTCFSATQLITRYLADSGMHTLTITFFNSIVIAAVVFLMFAALRLNPIKTFIENMKRPSQIGIGLTDSAWLFLYLPLVAGMNLGVLNALGRISVALTVISGVVFFKEKIPWHAYPLILVVIGAGIGVALVNIGAS